MKLFLHTLLYLAVLFATPAYAANLSAEKETELRSVLTSIMTEFDIDKSKSDAIEITKTDSYFSAIIPPISFDNSGATKTEIGEVAVNAIPLNNEGEWKLSFSLPDTIKTYDANGIETIVTTLGSQKSSVIFDNNNKIISKMNISYDDIKVTAANINRAVVIDNLTAIKDWKIKKDGKASGPFIYTIKNFSIKSAGVSSFNVKEVKLYSDLNNFNVKSKSALAESNAWEKNSIASTLNNVVRIYMDNSDDMSFGTSMTGMTITSQSPSHSTSESKIDSLNIEFGFNDLNKEKSSIDIKINHNSNPTPSLKSSAAPFIPYKTDIDIALNNLKKKDILGILLEPKLEARNEANNTLRRRVIDGLLPTLTQSSSTLDISKFSIDAHNYGISFTGEVVADDSAKYKTTASLKATLRGLDLIISILSGSNIAGLPPQFAQKITNITTPLTILKLIGKQRENTDVRDYDVEVDKIGTVMLNGSNISSLAGANTFTPIPNSGGETKPLPY